MDVVNAFPMVISELESKVRWGHVSGSKSLTESSDSLYPKKEFESSSYQVFWNNVYTAMTIAVRHIFTVLLGKQNNTSPNLPQLSSASLLLRLATMMYMMY